MNPDNPVADIFRRMPMLEGFVLDHDLALTEVAIAAWPGYVPSVELYEDLARALVDLAEERPEALEVLRGRTVARVLQ